MRQLPLAILFLCASVWFGPDIRATTLSGLVQNERGEPLSGVTVRIPGLHKGAITNDSGLFRVADLPRGIYAVQFTSVGSQTVVRTVRIDSDDVPLTVTLYERSLPVGGVTVTATPQPSDVLYSSQSVTSLDSRDLQRNRGQSVIDAIAGTPGVSTYSSGGAVVKPVIRGLSSQRVLVVSDGIRQEGQQWGDEHGIEVDPFDLERVEVVRGPGSLLYGSDALGGVVNLVTREPASADEGAPLLGGELSGDLSSGSSQAASNATLFGAKGEFGYRGSYSIREAGDTRTPGGRLFNSGESQRNFSAAAGLHGGWGLASVDFHRFDQNVQIHEDPAEEPNATPNQDVLHDRLHAHAVFPSSRLRFDINAGWQQNQRKEFEEAGATEPELFLDLETRTIDIETHHLPLGRLYGTFGATYVRQKNDSRAEEELIPDYTSTTFAGFIFEQVDLGAISFSGGLRYDNRRLKLPDDDAGDDDDEGDDGERFNYSSVSGAVGSVVRVIPELALTANIGRAWRAPSPFELFVDGVHEGTSRYEIGNRTLTNEESLTFDVGLRVASPRFTSELTGFTSAIRNYMFIQPTGVVDTVSGNQIFRHTQANATILGSEFLTRFAALRWLIVSVGVDLLLGKNEKTGRPLPIMPANRGRFAFEIRPVLGTPWQDTYTELTISGITRQSRVEQFETPTPGYGLVDLTAGTTLPFAGQLLSMDIGVKNLFDKRYRDHLSRYKSYADNPGLSAFAKLSLAFTVVK